MDVLALVISALSLLIAGVGTYQANKRANEALAESRKAAEDARWFAVQELSLIHISEPTRQCCTSRMPSSA